MLAFTLALLMNTLPAWSEETSDEPLPELESARATKAMDKDALIFREVYGEGPGAVKEPEFFDIFAGVSTGNPVKYKAVGNELIVEPTEMDILKASIFPLGQLVEFPMTLDIKFRTETMPGGSIQLMLCHNSKLSILSIGEKVLKSGGEQLGLDTSAVHTLRIVYDAQGRGRVYLLDEGTSMPLIRNKFNADYTSMDIRFYGAKIFIQEIKMYDRMP